MNMRSKIDNILKSNESEESKKMQIRCLLEQKMISDGMGSMTPIINFDIAGGIFLPRNEMTENLLSDNSPYGTYLAEGM